MPVLSWIGKEKIINHHLKVPYHILEKKYSFGRKLEVTGKVEIVDGIVKRAIYPEDELDRINYIPFWSHLKADEVGTAQSGKEILNFIMNKAMGFDTVKPPKLIDYEKEEITTLSLEFLETIKTKAESYVIYADLCVLSDDELTAKHIIFRKIPRDIRRI